MNEQAGYIRAHLLRSLKNTSARIDALRLELAEAVAEKARLERHLEQLQRDEKEEAPRLD